MLVPKKNRLAVYSLLFKDGVLCAKKDVFAPKHHELEVPNLHVMKLLESFVSKGFVTEVFNWQWFYWTLTDAGIEYLRSYLHLPAEIVPNSLKKAAKPLVVRRFAESEERRGGRGGRGGFRGGRGEYRGRGDGEAQADGERSSFRGRGRGRGGFRGGRSAAAAPAAQE